MPRSTSFPSGHSASAFAFATAVGDELPLAWLPLHALAAAVTYSRVHTGVHYPIPVHLQPAYQDLGYRPGDFPVSETVARKVLSLPIYPELTPRQVETVVSAVRAAEEIPSPA